MEYQRVMIIGGPGSGKSTTARMLGAITGLPVHHMDHIHHLPGWEQRPRAEKLAMARAVEARDAWIFEGGFSATYDSRAARADRIVWLDLPLWLSLARVLWRIARFRGTCRPDSAPGCDEQLDPDFLRWIVASDRRTRGRNRDLCAAHPGKAVRLRSPRAVARWLDAQEAAWR